MTVLLLENYPNDAHESMQRYADLLRRLLAGKGIHVETIRPEPALGRLKPSGQGLGKWLGYFDKFVLFPFALRSRVRCRKAELLSGNEPFIIHICDHSNAMYARWLQDVPHVVTCHDVLAIQSALGLIPGRKIGWTGRLLQRWIFSGLKRARRIICVSPETQNDLLALAPELKERVQTIENVLNYPYAPMPPEQARQVLASLKVEGAFDPWADRFLFHVGGNQWYKNREAVIRIFSCLRQSHPALAGDRPLKLVMAGKPPSEAIRHLVDEENLAGQVIFASGVTNEQLCALYSLAEVLVFPSLKEGFGWPLIEAQACGCPVVTSDLPPMNRLAGPAGLLANPAVPADFADKLASLLSEAAPVRQRRNLEALNYAAQFDSRAFAEQISQIYEIFFR